jgi:hypothetical protein
LGVIVLLSLMGWSTFGALRADASTVFVSETFTGSTTSLSHWTVPAAPSGHTNIACLTASGATAGTPIPGCQSPALDASGSGALRFTSTVGGEEGGVAYGLSIPTTQGIDATFDSYQYGSSSKADGIAFFLAAVNPADPAPVAAIGEPGGDLGYAGNSGNGNGMVDGYLGLGLDVFGNYSNSSFDGSGCSLPSWPGWSGGAVADQVTVRGPGNGTTGYCLLNSTLATDDGSAVVLQGSTSETNDAGRASALVPVEVVINPGSTSITTASGLSVATGDYEIAFTPIGGSRETLSGALPTAINGGIPSGLYPTSWIDSTTGLPYQLNLGWVGSTGSDTDIHEVNNITAQSITTTEVPVFDASLSNSPSSVQPDQDLTYTADVSVASTGNAESDQITVTDIFPSGETPLSSGLGGTDWSCGIAGQTVTCTYALAGYPAGTVLNPLSLPVEVTAAGGTDLTDSVLVGSDDAASDSVSDTITVEPPPGAAVTTTALSTSANPTTTGATTSLTATVSTASGTPTGTVDFEDGGTTINGCAAVALSSRVATCVTSFLASGGTPVPLTAAYSGSSSYQTSTGSLSQQVNGATPAISLTDSPSTLTSGESTTLAATVSTALTGVPPPTGTVEFESEPGGGGYAVISGCSAVAINGSGVATCATSLLASGSVYHLEAVYSGDGNYVAVTSSALAQAVTKANQAITFTSAYPSPAYYGNTYTVTATGGGSTSPVVFTGASTAVCTVTGSLVSFVGVGNCIVDANQAADANYNAAPEVDQSFTVSAEPTSFTASASPTALAHGNQTTLSASGLVSGATGAVTFATGGTTWCIATVSSGAASCTTITAPAVGTHGVTATYGGDTDHAGSTAGTSFIVTAVPVLGVSSSGTPPGASQGSSYGLTLRGAIESSGGPAYDDPTLTATLPAGETFDAVPTATGWSCALSGSSTVLTCTSTGAPISAGTSLASVPATVEISAFASGALQTGVSLADPADQATAVSTTAAVDVTAPPVLELSTSDTPSAAAAGTSYNLTLIPSLAASPVGPAYNDPTLTAILPGGETFAAAPSVTGWSCGLHAASTVVTCTSTLATITTPIAAGTALPAVLATVDIASGAAGSLETQASLTDAADLATEGDATAQVDVTPPPELSISTSDTPTGAAAGSDYSLILSPSLGTSGGPAYADPTMTVTLPGGEVLGSAPTVSGWDCSLDGTATVLTCTSTLTSFSSGEALPGVTANVEIGSAARGTLETQASLADPSDMATTAVADATVDVTATPVLVIGTAGTPAGAAAGTTYGLTLSSSLGGAPAGPAYDDPTLFAALPAGETFAGVPNAAGWSCSLSVGETVLTCSSTLATSAAPIDAGTAFADVTATVDIASSASATLQTTMALADGGDAATTVSTTATVDVTAPPVLQLTTSGTPSGAAAGTAYTLTLIPSLAASPAGPAYNDPTLTAILPGGETFAAAPSVTGWSCGLHAASTVVTCTSTLATITTPIAAGTALPAVLATVDIASGAAGSLETQASLTDAADLASGATATAITEVTAPPVLALSTSGTPDEGATAGTSYTLTFRPSLAGSPGGPAYSDPILAATLPSGETFVGTPSRSGWDCSLDGTATVLTCTSTLTSFSSGEALPGVTANVEIGSAARGTLETQASLADPSDMATTAVADATVDVTATPVLAVTTSGAPGAAAAGTSYSLTLSSSLNDAPAGPAYHQPTLTATLPSGEMFAEAPSVTGWSCELSDGSMVLSCDSTSAPIAAGASLAGVTATVDIASSALGTYQAAVSLTDPADLATAASATASVDVTATPVLELSTSGTPATAAEGSHYTLNVSVALSSLGGPIYNQLVVGVMLSPGETFAVAPSVTGWSCWLSDGGTLLGCMRTATTSVNPGTSLLSLSVQVEVSSTASGTMTTAIMAADSADGAAMAFTTVTTTVPVDTPETGAPAGPSSPWGLGMLLAGAGLLIVLEVTRRRRGGSDAHRA